MKLWSIATTYIRKRKLVSAMTILSIALGAGLLSSVLTLRRESEGVLLAEAKTADLVVGAKGSPLDLTLSSLYLMGTPTGNIPLQVLTELKADSRITAAAPLGLGDSYGGFRIVGTQHDVYREIFSRRGVELAPETKGRWFDDEFEVVIGCEVARTTGLRLGSRFHGTHGLIDTAFVEKHEDEFVVVGVLSPSASVNDRAILTSLESIWHLHEKNPPERENSETPRGSTDVKDHDHEKDHKTGPAGAEAHADEDITSVLVQLQSASQRWKVRERVESKTVAMAAIPLEVIAELTHTVMRPAESVLLAIAMVTIAVAALAIAVTLLQAAERRRRDVAILRLLGATPAEIFASLLLEGAILTVSGVAFGWLIGHVGVRIAVDRARASGIALNSWSIDSNEILALAFVALLGVLASALPAWRAYRRSPLQDLEAR